MNLTPRQRELMAEVEALNKRKVEIDIRLEYLDRQLAELEREPINPLKMVWDAIDFRNDLAVQVCELQTDDEIPVVYYALCAVGHSTGLFVRSLAGKGNATMTPNVKLAKMWKSRKQAASEAVLYFKHVTP